MRALIVFVCLGGLASCAVPGAPALDAAAQEYVRLARAMEAGEPANLDAVAGVRGRVDAADEQDGRRAFLLAQLQALERRARFLAGARSSIREEAASLGLEIPPYDAARAAVLRSELDAALPGSGPLAERLARHRQASAVPRSRLDPVARRLVGECRSRTPVPDDLLDAGIELTFVIERPWPAYTSYQDEGRSRVEIRRDAIWLEDDLLAVLCHETYPGHHLQSLVWDDLRDNRGWIELGVAPMFTPHGAMAERAAVAATRLAIPATQRPAVSRVLDDLAPLALSTAVAVLDGEADRTSGITRLREELLMPAPEDFLAFVERYRSTAAAYVTPLPEIRDWQSYFTLLRSPARLAAAR